MHRSPVGLRRIVTPFADLSSYRFFMVINFFGEFLCVVCFFFCYKPKGNTGVLFISVTQDVALYDEKIL